MRASTIVDEEAPTRLPDRPRDGRARRWSTWVRTTVLYAVTLWAVVTLVFLLPRLLPGDPGMPAVRRGPEQAEPVHRLRRPRRRRLILR